MHYYRVLLLAIILETSFGDKFKVSLLERVVYPKLLDARGLNGEKILRIEDGLVLTLEKSVVLAEDFVVIQDDGREQHMSGKELEKNLYHDRRHMSALSIEEVDGGWEVRGVLSDKLRIEPMPLKARSEDGSIAHKVSKIQKEGNYENDYIVAPDFVASERSDDSEQEFSVFMKVNLRYKQLSDPKVQFLLTGVELSGDDKHIVNVTREETSGSVTHNVTYFNGVLTLFNLAALIQNKTLKAPADLLLVVTGLDMVYDAGLDMDIHGLGFVGSLCSERRVLEVEDTPGLFSMIKITVHELGHSCGSDHDGGYLTNNECDPKAGYIMATFHGRGKDSVFSICSKREISNFMKSLSEECVNVTSKINHLQNITELPGTGMSKSDLCKRLYPEGGDSRPDAEEYPDCKAYCRNNDNEWSYENLWDGMECGEGKICLGGECVDTPPQYLPTTDKKKQRKTKSPKKSGSL
ncbi:A disintegrin and metalloproteinase with thrombospondin motifs 13-like [Ixodes scapularis]|uniref:A disintegrin and metalloproteinase with thrombospondin motifs 13-like n=1 Tax=Ixodes scapularis TaxID=6945 RepID=UPI001C38C0F1|nr:A disintegrin and metalloproteinase with thrombospondin motifs 13-like [Ixodes scapularis]